jgi:hypothetical protein
MRSWRAFKFRISRWHLHESEHMFRIQNIISNHVSEIWASLNAFWTNLGPSGPFRGSIKPYDVCHIASEIIPDIVEAKWQFFEGKISSLSDLSHYWGIIPNTWQVLSTRAVRSLHLRMNSHPALGWSLSVLLVIVGKELESWLSKLMRLGRVSSSWKIACTQRDRLHAFLKSFQVQNESLASSCIGTHV